MGTWRRDSQRELVGGECAISRLDFWPVPTVVVLDFGAPRDIPWQVPTASPSPDPNLYGINPTQDGQTMVGPLTVLAQMAGMQVPDSPQQDENEASETDSFLRDLELELFRRERGSLN